MSYREPPKATDPLILAASGWVFAIERSTGKTIWQVGLDTGLPVRIDVTHDRVFATSGRLLAAIHYLTGDLLWKAQRYDQVAGAIFLEGSQVFVASKHNLECFDATNGNSQWRHSFQAHGVGVPALGMPYRCIQADHGV